MFMSEGGDLGFSVTSRGQEGEERQEVGRARVPSNKEIQSGHLLLRPGTAVTLVFDNTFSVLR